MQDGDGANDGRPLISNRTMEIVVALALLAGCALVIYDSVRIGFGWRDGEGPAPGYYPFWVAIILGVSSLVNLFSAVRGHGAGEIFVALRPFGRVLAVLVPSLIYVGLIGYVGIYVASAIFIFFFMIIVGARIRSKPSASRRSYRSCCFSCSRNGSSCHCRRGHWKLGWGTERRLLPQSLLTHPRWGGIPC